MIEFKELENGDNFITFYGTKCSKKSDSTAKLLESPYSVVGMGDELLDVFVLKESETLNDFWRNFVKNLIDVDKSIKLARNKESIQIEEHEEKNDIDCYLTGLELFDRLKKYNESNNKDYDFIINEIKKEKSVHGTTFFNELLEIHAINYFIKKYEENK